MIETSSPEELEEIVSENDKLTKENVELKYEVALKDEEIRYLRRKLFQRSKESRKKRRTRANGR